MEDESVGNSSGARGSLKRLLESASDFFTAKLELVNIEIQEEKRRLLEILILATVVLIFGIAAITLLTFSVVAFFWESHRMIALFSVSGLYALVTIFLALRLQRKVNLPTKAFETTVEELKKDTDWIKNRF